MRVPPERPPGKLPAREYNMLVKLGKAFASMSAGKGARMLLERALVGDPSFGLPIPALPGLVKNVDALDYLKPYRPAKIVGQIFHEDDFREIQSRVCLEVRSPEGEDLSGGFVIMREGLAPGLIGPAWSSGICPAWIRADRIIDPLPGHCDIDTTGTIDDALIPVEGGVAELLWPIDSMSAGEQMGLIRFGGGGGAAEFTVIVQSSSATNGSGTGHATNPSTQWTYQCKRAEKRLAGYGSGASMGWTAISGAPNITVYNLTEMINAEITVGDGHEDERMGMGVILEHLDYDNDNTYEFAPRPIPNGVPIIVWEVMGPDGVEYWTEFQNATDGEC